MANVLPLITLPAQSLREISVEVDPAVIGTPDFQLFLDDLIATMYERNGIGIASPQVGKNIRVCIVDEKRGPQAYINPEITKRSEVLMHDVEGCLSVPGVWGKTPRSKRITFTALDRHGRRVQFHASGMMATVYQHELDHLDGVLFIDRKPEIIERLSNA